MKKHLPKILIPILILAIFMAPVSAGVNVNKVEAQEQTLTPDSLNANAKLSSGESIELSTPAQGIGYASAIFDFKVIDIKEKTDYVIETRIINVKDKDNPILSPEQEKTQTVSIITINIKKEGAFKNGGTIRICYGFEKDKCTSTDTETITGTSNIVLKEDTDYKLKVKLSQDSISDTATYFWTFKTGNKANNTSGSTTGDVKSYHNMKGYDLNCGTGFWLTGGGSLGGCIAGIFYVFWEASAWVARMAGGFLDFFVYYSTNDASYRNTFIEKGWSAIRDIANIFFIIALLYVAIKTILGLNVTDNKRLVGAVIIVALIINFSLFTTKVVIDTSNILAKVFYNNITSEKTGSTGAVTGAEGEKSISVGMIGKFNPQEIISSESYTQNGPGMFIFVTIILLAITLYTAYIFFSVALLFVTRVVSLWIAMIFSPLAFVSYAVPFEIPGFGHKEWWSDLLKNCFLAPIFIFFLYIIVLFLDIGKNITYNTTSTDPLQKIMGVVIPFVILFFLLKMAKEIAVKYSGKMGEVISKAGAMVGGLALGAATGGAALAGRTVIGGGGGWAANKLAAGAEKIGMGRTATKLRDVGDFARKSSFDARRVKIAGQSMASVTGMKVGEGQKGGWNEMKKQQVEKRQKRADELEKRGTGTEKKEKDRAEIDLKEKLLNTKVIDKDGIEIPVKLELENADKDIEKARIALNDIKGTDDKEGTKAALEKLRDAQDYKDKIRGIETTKILNTTTGEIERTKSAPAEGSIAALEKIVHRKKAALEVKSDEITTEYAKKISGNMSKNLNSIFRLGAYSRAGAEEAERKIRTGTKLDSGEKPK